MIMGAEEKQTSVHLELEFPFHVVNQESGQIGTYHASTKQGVDVELNVEKVNETVRLQVSGSGDFLHRVENTYSCCISVVRADRDATSSNHPENRTNPSDYVHSGEEHKKKRSQTKTSSETANAEHKEKTPISENMSRRSCRLERKYGDTSIVRRLNMTKRSTKPRSKHSEAETLRESSASEEHNPPGPITIEPHVSDISTDSLTRDGFEEGEADIQDNEVVHASGESNRDEHLLLKSDKENVDLEQKMSEKKQIDEAKKSRNEPDFILALQIKNKLQDEEKKLFEEIALQCSLCRYAAVHFSTFKSHIRIKHGIKWKEYLGVYGKPSTGQDSGNLDQELPASESHVINEIREPESEIARGKIQSSSIYAETSPRNCLKRFPCDICKNLYSSKAALVYHLRKKHPNDSASKGTFRKKSANPSIEVQCQICYKTLRGERIFSHMTIDHIKEPDFDEKYQKIQKVYNKELYRQRHKPKANSLGRCPYCDTELKVGSLTRHVKFHCKKNVNAQRRYDCALCSYFTLDAGDFLQHKETAHIVRPKYMCEACAATYNTSSGLRQHMRIKHNTIFKKAFNWRICPDCGKIFPTKQTLARHMTVHNPEYHHSCDICGKRFVDKSSVIVHRRTIHFNEYRYQCATCGRGFEKQKRLETHQCSNSHSKMEDWESIPHASIPEHREQNTAAVKDEIEAELLPDNFEYTVSSENSRDGNVGIPGNEITGVQAEIGSGVVLQTKPLDSDLSEERIMVFMESEGVDNEVAQHTLVNTVDLEDGSTIILLPGNSGLGQNEMYAVMHTPS